MRLRMIAFSMVLGLSLAAPAWAETFKVSRQETLLSFRVRNVFSQTNGTFRDFQGTIEYDKDNPELSSASGEILVDSIDTGFEMRDKHLRSKELFDVEQYPKITFKTIKAVKLTATTGKVEGLITIHGIERPVTLDLVLHGMDTDMSGRPRLSFTATGTINRKDFGLKFNDILETGRVLVGSTVTIMASVEAFDDTGKEKVAAPSSNPS